MSSTKWSILIQDWREIIFIFLPAMFQPLHTFTLWHKNKAAIFTCMFFVRIPYIHTHCVCSQSGTFKKLLQGSCVGSSSYERQWAFPAQGVHVPLLLQQGEAGLVWLLSYSSVTAEDAWSTPYKYILSFHCYCMFFLFPASLLPFFLHLTIFDHVYLFLHVLLLFLSFCMFTPSFSGQNRKLHFLRFETQVFCLAAWSFLFSW